MKFPSIDLLAEKSFTTAKRFPLVLLSSFIGTGIMIYIIDANPDHEFTELLTKIVLTCTLGLTLFLSLAIFMERRKYSALINTLILFTGILLLLVYYLTLAEDLYTVPVTRHILFTIALHLVVSFIPFIQDADTNGFWQYNKILFIRILSAILYSGVLFTGLALALLAIDNLFNVDIDSDRYGQLWIFLMGIFNTWFFLAGVPEDFEGLKTDYSYPKGIKVFTQYVLLPLVIIYLVILYAYSLKILVQWDLPQGWVSYLIIAFSIAGILSLLLIYPVQNQKENSWIKTFSRWFYLLLFPLIALLFLAISKRLSDYGITEERYFVFALAVWLLGIAFYFTFSKKKNIKIIPISLCIIVFLSSVGPWSAFSIAKISQKQRFEKIFQSYGLLKNGKITGETSKINKKDVKQVSSIVDFFDERKELEYISEYFPPAIDKIIAKDSIRYYGTKSDEVLELIGMIYISRWDDVHAKNYYFNSEGKSQLNIKGYDYYIEYNYYSYPAPAPGDERDSASYQFSFDEEKNILKILERQPTGYIFEDVPMQNFISELASKYGNNNNIPQNEMILMKEGKNFSVKILVKNISLETKYQKLQVQSMDARILIKTQ